MNVVAKPTSEYILMNTKYNEYVKNTYENLINIANNWILEEGEVGFPLYGYNGQVVGSSHKKMKKKSDVQIQVYMLMFIIFILINKKKHILNTQTFLDFGCQFL